MAHGSHPGQQPDHPPAHDTHSDVHHPTAKTYALVGLILTIITIIEVSAFYIPAWETSRIYVPSILGGSVAVAVLWRYIFADTGIVNMIILSAGGEAINWFGDPRYALFTITLLHGPASWWRSWYL
mgnify:CR=1 FL=1